MVDVFFPSVLSSRIDEIKGDPLEQVQEVGTPGG